MKPFAAAILAIEAVALIVVVVAFVGSESDKRFPTSVAVVQVQSKGSVVPVQLSRAVSGTTATAVLARGGQAATARGTGDVGFVGDRRVP